MSDSLRVLIATSTLAWGVNLPARRALVLGVKRGSSDVHEMDVQQMVGRAGRAGLDEKGDAYVLLPVDRFQELQWKYSRTPHVISNLVKSTLLFHAVAEIDTGTVHDAASLAQWHSRSLAAQQGHALTEATAEETIQLLKKCGAIRQSKDDPARWEATGLGKVSSWLYLDPRNVFRWAMNFAHVNNNDLWDKDPAVSFALGSLPEGVLPYVPRDVAESVGVYSHAVSNVWKIAQSAYPRNGWAESWCYWLAMSGREPPPAVYAMFRTIKSDIERTMTAVRLIDSMWGKWKKDSYWDSLELRIKYGVPAEMAFMVTLPGIGAARAKKLWELGIRDISQISIQNLPMLQAALGAAVAKKAVAAAEKI